MSTAKTTTAAARATRAAEKRIFNMNLEKVTKGKRKMDSVMKSVDFIGRTSFEPRMQIREEENMDWRSTDTAL
jgi:hypothetical protein